MDQSWLGDYYKLTALIQQLFVKIPKHVLHSAVRKVASFTCGFVIPQQAADVYQIVAACASEAPELTFKLMLEPLMARIIDDCKAMDGMCQFRCECLSTRRCGVHLECCSHMSCKAL